MGFNPDRPMRRRPSDVLLVVAVFYLAAGRLTFECDCSIIYWSLASGGYVGSHYAAGLNDDDGNFGPSLFGNVWFSAANRPGRVELSNAMMQTISSFARNGDGVRLIELTVDIMDLNHLERVRSALRKVQGVIEVERTAPQT